MMDYNRRKKRAGTLWEGRFKSVAVEGRQEVFIQKVSEKFFYSSVNQPLLFDTCQQVQ